MSIDLAWTRKHYNFYNYRRIFCHTSVTSFMQSLQKSVNVFCEIAWEIEVRNLRGFPAFIMLATCMSSRKPTLETVQVLTGNKPRVYSSWSGSNRCKFRILSLDSQPPKRGLTMMMTFFHICSYLTMNFQFLVAYCGLIFLAFLSKSNHSMIIVSTKLFAVFQSMRGNWETERNIWKLWASMLV